MFSAVGLLVEANSKRPKSVHRKPKEKSKSLFLIGMLFIAINEFCFRTIQGIRAKIEVAEKRSYFFTFIENLIRTCF
jgi:hypothetical protein